jgi:hypothetical protein
MYDFAGALEELGKADEAERLCRSGLESRRAWSTGEPFKARTTWRSA